MDNQQIAQELSKRGKTPVKHSPKYRVFQVRISEEDLGLIKQVAADHQVTVSEWIRQRAVGEPVEYTPSVENDGLPEEEAISSD